MSDPGDYYDRKDAEARELRKQIREAEARGAGEIELAVLRRKLAMAEYVGD